MQPFRFSPDPARAAELVQRVARAHRIALEADREGRLGIPCADLERLATALAAFDCQAFAARLGRWPQWRWARCGEQLHFVHARAPAEPALPLLLLHGWPGSFLEFQELTALLHAGAPAYHVVAPSLPGYGFSTRDPGRRLGAAAIAEQMAELMQQLGYERFLVQGGDWGSVVGAELARRHPQRCLGLHLNLVPVRPPPAGDPLYGALPAQEREWLAENARLFADGMGYFAIQSTRPQTLAVALADSPLGLLAWLGEKFLAWSDRDANGMSLVSDAAILDHVALYWLTDTIGSSVRLYHDEARPGAAPQRVEVPTGVAVFPREILKTPRAWVERHFALVHWSLAARGGHFAALEVPQLLAADLRSFTRTVCGATA